MSLASAPTAAEIDSRLEELLQRSPDARILGVHSQARRAWPESLVCRDRRFRVAWCESELEMRELLDATERNGEDGLVLLTPLDGSALGNDVLARLSRARLEEPDRWLALRAMFHARDVDPRLRAQSWLADLLLERAPPEGYPPVPAGVLDLEAVWRAVQERLLGLPEGRADLPALLRWTLDATGLARLAALPETARQKIAERLAGSAGAAGGLAVGAMESGRGSDAIPIGLAAGVVFAGGMPTDDLREAAVRLERFVGDARVDAGAAAPLAAAARAIFDGLDPADPARFGLEARANALLTEIRAEAWVAQSPALASGLEARMREAGVALTTAAASGLLADALGAWKRVERVAGHDRARDAQERVGRARTAARLARWLCTAARMPAGISDAAAAYATDLSFVDRARDSLRGGDPLPELALAYARLQELAFVRRHDADRAFALSLREWNAAGGSLLPPGASVGEGPIPVEHVLDRIVAPLARERPALLLVLDGLSLPLWHELAEGLPRQGWTELAMPGRPYPCVAAAALPTVTEVSRASLLCGRLTTGDQGAEKSGFAKHPALLSVSRAGNPPRLFHKAELGSGPGLSEAATAALTSPDQRLVGIVHNAVDAELSGSDQLNRSWSAESLRQLCAVLRVAQDGGRVLIVTADHGHVIEAGTSQGAGAPGDRWRTLSGVRAGEGEILLEGGRVLAPDGSRAVIAAWSERLRYAGRRAGYHGGASPEEVLVPVAVLAASQPPREWDAAPPAEPWWWRDPSESQAEAASGRARTQREVGPTEAPPRRRSQDPRQPELFAEPAGRAAPAPASATVTAALPSRSLIGELIESETYAAQRRLAGRGAPADGQVRAILAALAARGGRLSRGSLAQAIAMPALRIGGLVSAAGRVLNVDQARVLAWDGDEVVLDEGLLRLQFGLTRRR